MNAVESELVLVEMGIGITDDVRAMKSELELFTVCLSCCKSK